MIEASSVDSDILRPVPAQWEESERKVKVFLTASWEQDCSAVPLR